MTQNYLDLLVEKWLKLTPKERENNVAIYYETYRAEAHQYVRENITLKFIWTIHELEQIRTNLNLLLKHLGSSSYNSKGPSSDEYKEIAVLVHRIPDYIEQYTEFHIFSNIQGLVYFFRELWEREYTRYKSRISDHVASETPGLLKKFIEDPGKIKIAGYQPNAETDTEFGSVGINQDKDGYWFLYLPKFATEGKVREALVRKSKGNRFLNFIEPAPYYKFLERNPNIVADAITKAKEGHTITLKIPKDLNINVFNRILQMYMLKELVADGKKTTA